MRQIKRSEPRGWLDLYFELGGWLSLVAGVGMLILTTYSVFQYRLGAAFADRGVAISAEIVDRKIIYEDNDTFRLTFQFQPPGGSYTIEKKVGESYYNLHEVGSTTTIYHLPDRPEKIELFKGQTDDDAILFQIVSGLFGVVGCAFLWFSGQKANRAVKARKYGEQVIVRVASHEILTDKHGNDRNLRRIHWEEGSVRSGASLAHPKTYALGWDIGDEITVFHGPRESWWEGDVGPRDPAPRHVPLVRD